MITIPTPIEFHTVSVFENASIASVYVAERIANLIKRKQASGKLAVLGLATGNTPILVYQELVRMYKEEGLSFHNVITFNLDEYYPMDPRSTHSYVHFMNVNLFDHVNIRSENINIPDGSIALSEVAAHCQAYENKIRELGGVDLQILGIGLTGHIGFNEPGSEADSQTRLVELNALTRSVAIDDFGGLEHVPSYALSMGVQTIAQAKEVMLLAWTEKKAAIIEKALRSKVSAEVPATYLQNFPKVDFILDKEAASKL